jgi:hypothetical protein
MHSLAKFLAAKDDAEAAALCKNLSPSTVFLQ